MKEIIIVGTIEELKHHKTILQLQKLGYGNLDGISQRMHPSVIVGIRTWEDGMLRYITNHILQHSRLKKINAKDIKNI